MKFKKDDISKSMSAASRINQGYKMEENDKLRLRREKLAKWKLKKKNFEGNEKDQEIDGTTSPYLSNENIKEERRKKLEAWKKKRELKEQEKETVLPQKSNFNVDAQVSSDQRSRKPGKNRKKARKRPAFGEDSDEDNDNISSVKMFKPSEGVSLDVISESDDDNNDLLDEFIRNLNENRERSTLRPSSTEILSSDEEGNPFSSETEEFKDNLTSAPRSAYKKRIQPVDYSNKTNLIPLQKALYREAPELQSMSEEEVSELRMTLDNIKILGSDCPKPVIKWAQLGLSSEIMELITDRLQFETLTPIQSQAIPAIMSGRDVIGISKTGSGKTIAYLLPLIRQIKAQPGLRIDETGPIGLLLTPTRELAVQVQEEIIKFKRNSKISSICCVGGSELKQQINDIKKGVDIIVATPGRFIDLMTLNSGKLLSPERISFVVMDEADRLFDLGFGPQVNQIMSCIRPDKQCVLFSATFPTNLKHFAAKTLSDPIQISINSKSLINENIEQKVQVFDEESVKFEFLSKRLQDRLLINQGRDEKTIIFVSSQQTCDLLYEELLLNGIKTFAIHAGRPSSERLQNLQKFKDTKNAILIATEVLSRGLNVPEVSLVIIYNAARTIAQYVHTTGRTGRASNKGVALTFLMVNELSSAYILVKCMREDELSRLPMVVFEKLKEMNEKFTNGLQSGEYKLIQGFGGKGLERLEELTEAKQKEELKLHENGGVREDEEEELDENEGLAREMKFIRGQRKEKKNTTYYAHVYINDLPKLARWEATKNDTISSLKHETGCNIESKGKFYPEGQTPQLPTDEPKLYLVVESNEEKDVTMAVEILDSKVKEGLRKSSLQDLKTGKYRI